MHDQLFEIPERYELVSCVGRGAFGIVASAKTVDQSSGKQNMVAVKKIIIREDNILEVKR